MKKVLFLYTEIAPYLIACVERLVKDHGAEVHIVRWPVNDEAPFEFSERDGITLHDRKEFTEASLRRFAAQLAPDILLISGWVDKAYLHAGRDAVKRGIPSVMISDTAWRGGARQWAAVAAARVWVGRTFTHAWVTGKAQARYAHYLGFPKERTKLGFYSADIDRFSPLAQRFRQDRSAHYPHRFLCVARYIPSKGHQYMLEAFAELCDAGRAGDWELWCIGTGELYPMPFRHPRVKHLGFVQAEEVWKYMEQCGVFILPSLYEPWGVVVHEHAAAGLPLLLSNAVGARHRFLREGKNGWCFKAGDKESLKDALGKAMATPDAELLRMGVRSAELAMAWGPAQWAATLMELIPERHG
ncbi:MAG: glycosyltransferase family 4 protein [Bacteroidetes bacterium]|nr:glycosyltransferase family 4 protein [Bacteroidota bacterium]